ncbi:MAG: NADH-ubiquinone oxidoreductase-F iron-sulfur binding region domain-containing protein [Sporichthyaceae bacterium]
MLLTQPADALADYRACGGYAVADGRSAEEIVKEVSAAGLRGRGGAWFPVERKWLAAREMPGPRVLVANGAEDEPGSRKDRHLMANAPHLVLDGALAAAIAIEADTIHLYVNCHAASSLAAMRSALAEALDAGLFAGIAVSITEAPATYVAGEDSAAVEFLETGNAQPRKKPPFPTEAGLNGRPTVVGNVETLAHVALIVRDGAETFRSHGTPDCPGTMLITLPVELNRPGVYEVPVGSFLDEVLEGCGGGFVDGPARGVQVGGPASGWLNADQLHVAMDPAEVAVAGSTLGCGAVRVLPAGHCSVDAVVSATEFFSREQCGKCPPCRMATQFIHNVGKALAVGKATAAQLDTAPTLLAQVRPNTACSLPAFALPPLATAREVFPDDFAKHLAGEDCGLIHREQSLRIEDTGD